MVIACIARDGACLNGLAKVVEDGNLRFKRLNKTPLNNHQLKIGVNVYITSLPSLVFTSPLTLFNRKCKLKDKFPNEI